MNYDLSLSTDSSIGQHVASLEDIVTRSETSGLNIGDVFCDTRPEVIAQIAKRVKPTDPDSLMKQSPRSVYQRVLHVHPDGIWKIVMNDNRAMPEWVLLQTALAYIRSGEWIRVSEDPLRANRMSTRDFSSPVLKRRDRDNDLIRPILELGEKMFDPSLRWQTILKVCKELNVRPNHVYRVLRRSLQGGMTPNAVIGRWFKRRFRCGLGAGILSVAEVRDGLRPIRIGRRRRDEVPLPRESMEASSFHVTAVDVKKIILGAKQYLHTPTGGSVHRAWLLTIADLYLPDLQGLGIFEIEAKIRERGPGHYPSERQYRYWIKSDRQLIARLKARVGRQFDLKFRSLNSRTEDKTCGPGTDFQIDPTPYDVIIVHEITRRPIGRITLYVVVDCFSHLVVGYHLHVGNAGYEPASLALLATARNKVELCREFGITISDTEWPSACLPVRLRADSELSSLKAHALAEEKLLEVTITPPYRADLKGLIESILGSATETARHLPGYSTGNRKRATISPDATAALDYRELNQIIIRWILQHNRRPLPDYNRTEGMIRDGLIPTPLNLWHWGVSQCCGRRRTWDMELLQMLCLPRGEAIISRRGLEFKHLVYEPSNGEISDFGVWQVEAASTRNWKETVTYNPLDVSYLWLHFEDRLVRMKLAQCSQAEEHWTWYDHDASHQEMMDGISLEQTVTIPLEAIHEIEKLKTVLQGIARTEAARGSVAERRYEKIDKPSERQDQKDRISGVCVISKNNSCDDLQGAPSESTERIQQFITESLKQIPHEQN